MIDAEVFYIGQLFSHDSSIHAESDETGLHPRGIRRCSTINCIGSNLPVKLAR